MITNPNSWKFFVVALVVLIIMFWAGIKATTTDTIGYVFGVANMVLAIVGVIVAYLKLRDK